MIRDTKAHGGTRFHAQELPSSRNGVRVYELRGVFTNCPASYEFLSELQEVLGESGGTVVLDVGQVQYMTSGGLGILAALSRTAGDAGWCLVLAGTRPRVSALLQVARLQGVFPSYDSVDAAVRAVRSGEACA